MTGSPSHFYLVFFSEQPANFLAGPALEHRKPLLIIQQPRGKNRIDICSSCCKESLQRWRFLLQREKQESPAWLCICCRRFLNETVGLISYIDIKETSYLSPIKESCYSDFSARIAKRAIIALSKQVDTSPSCAMLYGWCTMSPMVTEKWR